jgi:hypothetical protein
MNQESMNEQAEQATKPDITNAAIDYAKAYYELALVKLHQKTADVSAVTFFGVLALVLSAIILLFIGIAGGIYLGSLMNNAALGFLLITLVYIVLLLFFFITRKKLFFPFIKNLIVNIIYE